MTDAASRPRSTAWQNAINVLQEAAPPSIPDGAHAMTIVIEYPPGDPGTPRVIRAGETFWEPGGDVIHYQDCNNRDDIKVRFLVTMLCSPGQPILTRRRR
jgi:hypothetical protein